jgi:glutamine synthetase
MFSPSNKEVTCLEYIWVDGIGELRSKIKILQPGQAVCFKNFFKAGDEEVYVPWWNFDGSSTGQAIGKESDVLLKPVHVYKNPFFNAELKKAYLVLCECYDKNGETPHQSNTRAMCAHVDAKYTEHGCLFGIEQEYVLFDRPRERILSLETEPSPYKWVETGDPGCGGQGPYYCSVGGDRALGRIISERHLVYCLRAGIQICGTNGEVMASQWEFQVGACSALKTCDDLIVARYILHKLTEEYGCSASLHPKPHKGDWNGSGAHTNFSTEMMRNTNGIAYIIDACEKMRLTHDKDIELYGKFNELRLTGAHETSSIHEYSWAPGNRGCSVRIPLQVVKDKCGYLEDRRPASNCDPYLVTASIMESVLSDSDG